MKEIYPFEPFQVLCLTRGEVLFQRFQQRSESGERHPGHVDQATHEELKSALLKGRAEPLDIGGSLLEVDTTGCFASADYERIDYEGLFAALGATLRR